MAEVLFQAVNDADEILCIGHRRDVERIVRRDGGDWRIEPYTGPPLATRPEEGFSWFRIWAGLLLGVAAVPAAHGMALLLIASGNPYAEYAEYFALLGNPLFSLVVVFAAMQLRVRRWRRWLYWPPCVLFLLVFGFGVRGFVQGWDYLSRYYQTQAFVGSFLALAAACVVCFIFDRARAAD